MSGQDQAGVGAHQWGKQVSNRSRKNPRPFLNSLVGNLGLREDNITSVIVGGGYSLGSSTVLANEFPKVVECCVIGEDSSTNSAGPFMF